MCHDAHYTEVYVFIDGPKSLDDKLLIKETADIVNTFTDFKKLNIIQHETNIGLAKSVIYGVDYIFTFSDRIIVLEDDLTVGKGFLKYMNGALEHFRSDSTVWHISAFNYNIDSSDLQNSFLWHFMNCWGWATWDDRWCKRSVKSVRDVKQLKLTLLSFLKFNIYCSYDIWSQVLDNFYNRRKTWAVFWYLSIFMKNGLCLNPYSSIILNNGFDQSGETKKIDNNYFIPKKVNDCLVFNFDKVDLINIKNLSLIIKGYRSIGSGFLKTFLKSIFYYLHYRLFL